MSYTPFAHAESLRIGTVEFISPDEVKVLLDIEAPDSVALNAGDVRSFPRVNGYVLLPIDDGYLVGQIEWLTIERSSFPKRRGVQDFGLIDLPYPSRKMSLVPIGMLRAQSGKEERYTFKRGAEALPSLGSPVLLPTEKQLRSIIESGERRYIHIGTSPLAGNADVCIDPDRLFGRHLAVLGNTGSGKSCSVAGLIRWSLEAAKQERKDGSNPNARFIILDPNGEYSRAFSDPSLSARIFKISPSAGEFALKVPLWFWNSGEWSSFTQASAKTQRPLLRRALREVKAGRIGISEPSVEEKKLELRLYLSYVQVLNLRNLRSGDIKVEATKYGFFLHSVYDDLEQKKLEFPEINLQSILDTIKISLGKSYASFPDKATGKPVIYYKAFTEQQAKIVSQALDSVLNTLGGIIYEDGPDEDIPIAFKGTDLADHLQQLSLQENVSQYLDFLVSRIRTFLSDSKINSVVGDSESLTLGKWLDDYIGIQSAADGPLAILDLSLIPTEVVHIIVAVTARMIFESLQRYRKENQTVLPTVLIMEEAHTFIKRYKDEAENYDASMVCCQVFERIAREGRKFGLSLVLSSQRPSELSPTVLSQCNTFLLHRISNDRDQELVSKLVPDNLRGLLRELPSLPSQNAILLGWASELPILVRMDDLPKTQQPRSDDPDFWDVWTGINEQGKKVERNINWTSIADKWQGKS